MNRRPFLLLTVILLLLILIISVCRKEDIPTIVTTGPWSVTAERAVLGGDVKNDGGTVVINRGVCWSLSQNPTVSLSTRIDNGYGLGPFTIVIDGLIPGNKYHARAYAINREGTGYGKDTSFTTRELAIPAVTTISISNYSSYAAISGGNVTDDGGGSITAGVCYGTTPDPTVGSSLKTTDFYNLGTYTAIIPDLKASTTYYARAYVTNQSHTAYGEQVTFTTLSDVADIEGNKYGFVNIGTQVWLTENLKAIKYNDGTSIPLVSIQTTWNTLTTPGYCWYNNDGLTYKLINGALYNWQAVNTGKLCPAGWHVPTDADWSILVTYLGGETVAGTKLLRYNYTTTNSLFWATPCGIRDTITGFVDPNAGCGVTENGRWWSSTSSTNYNSWARWISSGSELFRAEFSKKYGLSVRCIKN
jgi:uncharacterized protein (TIGR02145 family)